jgi:hypothetical protein
MKDDHNSLALNQKMAVRVDCFSFNLSVVLNFPSLPLVVYCRCLIVLYEYSLEFLNVLRVTTCENTSAEKYCEFSGSSSDVSRA